MIARLFSDSNIDNVQLLKDIFTLDPSNKKSNDLRFGEAEVKRICRTFNVDELVAMQGLRDFRENLESILDNFKLCLALQPSVDADLVY